MVKYQYAFALSHMPTQKEIPYPGHRRGTFLHVPQVSR